MMFFSLYVELDVSAVLGTMEHVLVNQVEMNHKLLSVCKNMKHLYTVTFVQSNTLNTTCPEND